MTQKIQAVVFDMDGVLIDSEQVWDEVRRDFAADHGGTWTPEATRAMQGMSSPEWSRYMADTVGVQQSPEQINQGVLAALLGRYETSIPFLPGAQEAVSRMAAHWPLGLASSSNRPIIDRVLAASGLDAAFEVTLSTEEVRAGKPAPDVYTQVCARLKVEPSDAAAIEDSTNGLQSAKSAGLQVIAIPNADYPPDPEVLDRTSSRVLTNIGELTPTLVESLS